jgi:hypothetical protein
MLRTGAFSTTALPHGLFAQLFFSSTKAALQHAGQVSALIDVAEVETSSRAGVTRFVQGVEASPPVVTIYWLNEAQEGLDGLRFVSPYAPLFDVAI